MKKPSNTQKALVALAVLTFSFGALLWQVAQFQKRNAEIEAAIADPMLNLQWRTATLKERAAAFASIKNQLEAFKRDDYSAATKYQSRTLRPHFPDAKAFRRMIQSSYPQFAHYKSVAFGLEKIDKTGKYFKVPVTVTGVDGVKVGARYLLVLEEGVWRVSGVDGGNPPPGYRFKNSPDSLKT